MRRAVLVWCALSWGSGCASADAGLLLPTVEIEARWSEAAARSGEPELTRAAGGGEARFDWSVVALWDVGRLWAEVAP